jgi:predicted DNA-binding transcriptional regulator YafY
MTKAERLLYLINLIKSHPNLSSRELAEKCEVSERTIFRDLNSLASISFPIYYDQGYKFLQGAFLPTLNLTDEELSALHFAFEFSPLKSISSLSRLVEEINTKLETSKAKPLLGNLVELNSTQETEAPSEKETSRFFTMFKTLNLAINQKKAVKIRYRGQGNHTMETLIEPYALVQRNPHWQVLCFCRDCKKVTYYDINKIEDILPTSKPFKSKLNLDKTFTIRQ